MKTKPMRKFLPLALAIALTFTCIPPIQAKADANIQSGLGAVNVGLISNSGPFTSIGFAGKQWDVIGYNGTGVDSGVNTLTLLLKNGQSVAADWRFDNGAQTNQYSGSDLQARMSSAYNAIPDAREKSLVRSRSFLYSPNYGVGGYYADGVGFFSVADQYFWPLGAGEASTLNLAVRKWSSDWWLRSPGSMDTAAAYADQDGLISPEGIYVASAEGIRPACNIYVPNTLFTSDAVGGKSSPVGTISSATVPSGVIKLTLTDTNTADLSLAVTDKSTRSVKPSQTISVPYTGAITGTGKYVSCVILAGSAVKYYGKLADLSGAASPDGTASIQIPADIVEGNYTLRLFNEEINGDNETDFASTPEDIPFSVDALPYLTSISPANGAAGIPINGSVSVTFSEPMDTSVGSIALGGGSGSVSGGVWSNGDRTYTVSYTGLDFYASYTVFLSGFRDKEGNVIAADSSNRLITGPASSSVPLSSVIGFGGKQWVVIGNSGQGVFSFTNNMTLLLRQGQSIGDKVQFYPEDSMNPQPECNDYHGSTLEAALISAFDNWAMEPREKALVQGRTFIGGSGDYNTGTYDPDGISGGDAPNQAFWPLSVYEFNSLPLSVSVRNFGDDDGWWLRTPGMNYYMEAFAIYTSLYRGGKNAGAPAAMRPAMSLDTTSFFFASPASGGKGGSASPNLTAYTQPTGVMKLTLKDTDTTRMNLHVSDKTSITASAGEAISLAYTGAITGAGKYVSCVLVGSDHSIKYYGKLKDLSSAGADGFADITLPVDMPAGNYTLQLYNEEINGDNETDFASEPENISLTVDTLPTVSSITPANHSVSVAAGGTIAINFSEPMDTATPGVVTLSGGGNTLTLGSGSWANGDQTYTANYAGLNYNTEYTINVSGFKDKTDIQMRPYSYYQFTTGSKTISISTTAVGFGGKLWEVIGNQGQGIYSAPDTITLLLQDGQSVSPDMMFRNVTEGSEYARSDLMPVIDAVYTNLPDAREQSLVQGRYLDYTTALWGWPGNDPDKVFGIAVPDAKFWPLSVAEFTQLPTGLHKFGSNGWWLRSPSYNYMYGSCVDSDGNLDILSQKVNLYTNHGVRPAFRMDTSPLLFVSSAAGGKSGSPGSILSAAGQPSGPIKFTMQDTDTSRLNLSVASENPIAVRSGDTLSVAYTGAVGGANKYVSCVITGANDSDKYYGKLVDLTGGPAAADGTATIALPADMPEGSYTIRLFNEQINGDNITDFASVPEDIPLTVDNTPPTVSAVTPGGARNAISGQISITFSEPVDTASGYFSLTGGASPIDLSGGSWSDGGTTYTVSYTGLDYGTEYTVDISGFKDFAGSEMAADSANRFTTIPAATLISVTAPADITGVASGTAKTAAALGLPSTVTLVTDDGDLTGNVTWDVASCPYNPSLATEQTFTINGTITPPDRLVNPNGVSLNVAAHVTVLAKDKTLVSITAPEDVTGVPNGVMKTAAALCLPSTVLLVTDFGSVSATVSWNVSSSSYQRTVKTEQTFTVNGTVSLHAGVVNPNGVSLSTTVNVTVLAQGVTNKTLVSITAPANITGMAHGTAKTAAALSLPASVTLVTDNGNVSASVAWDVDASSYDPSATGEQTFTVSGAVSLPGNVINPNSVSLSTTASVTVLATPTTNKILVSITAPAVITGLAHGTAKTAAALGLPSTVVLVTDGGNVPASVNWNVDSCSYDPSAAAEQTFTVSGAASLPGSVVNPNGVSLAVTISVTVNAAPVTDKTLVSIIAPAAIPGVAHGTAKDAAALGLPSTVTLATDNGSVSASVTWDVDASSYDPSATGEQTFMVNGSVTLPDGVINPNGVSLNTTVSVTVLAATSTDKTLVSITATAAIPGVAHGTAKTAAALGLPSTVTLTTDNGSVSASVTWDVDACTYDPSAVTEQTFTVNGTVSLPSGVINPNGVSLNITVNITVLAAPATGKTLISVTAPVAITGVAHGTEKTAAALGLPRAVMLATEGGNVSANVTWDVASNSYDPAAAAEQTFTVNGTVSLPGGVINPNGVSLNTTVSVTVLAAPITGKILVSVTAPAAITGLAHGTAKTAAALGLPATIILVTDDGNISTNVAWDVDSCAYAPSATSEQTFTVNGTVSLPDGVTNPNSVSLTTSITVTVVAAAPADTAPSAETTTVAAKNTAASTDKTLVSVNMPAAVTSVANGTAKTAAALGLPGTVNLATSGGDINASVTWDVASCSYDPSDTGAQSFTVNGRVSLPPGIINPNNVSLNVAVTVIVNGASAQPTTDIYVQNQYIVDYNDRVTVDLTRGSSILSADQMDRLISNNQDEPIILSGNGYTITFPRGSLGIPGGRFDYDLGIQFNTGGNYALVQSLAGDDFVLMLAFNFSGALPGEAEIHIYVGTQYAGQTLVYQYYNPSSGKLEYLQDSVVGSDGYAIVKQSHCSEYVLSVIKNMQDAATTVGGNVSNFIWWLLGGILAAGIVALAILGIRKRMRRS